MAVEPLHERAAAILEAAADRDLIGRNPARGRGRKVRERPPARTYLETAEQIAALLNAAQELDEEARADRRAILATLTFAGLRIGELCSLRWSDVDLTTGWLTVGEAKTPAGLRRVKIRGALRPLPSAMRSDHRQGSDGFVFATRTGRRPSRENIRSRVLLASVERANGNLAKDRLPPLPQKLTPTPYAAPSRASSTPSAKIPESSWMKWDTPIPRFHCASTGNRCGAARTRSKRFGLSSRGPKPRVEPR